MGEILEQREKERILVLGPRPWDVEVLNRQSYRDRFEFIFRKIPFYDMPLALIGLRFNILSYIEQTVKEARELGVQGVLGIHDYPASLVAAAVAEKLDLPGPRTEKILACSHKYASREFQKRAVPHATPAFALFDPFRVSASSIPLDYPIFIKPVKGTMSIRASQVTDSANLQRALKFSLAEKIVGKSVMKPFHRLLKTHTSFDLTGYEFIAEEVLKGIQVNLDGYVCRGRVTIMGVVDSVMYPGTISFQRFEYPSRLSSDVIERMSEICVQVMEASGFDNSCFNMELMYDPVKNSIHIIEINPRMACQFGELYEQVDGIHTYDIQLSLATGKIPEFPRGLGKDKVAASFVLRTFQNKKVLHVPTRGDVEAVMKRFPGASVTILCKTGCKLSASPQDMGSFRYAYINLGAGNWEELMERFQVVESLLPFRFSDL